MILCFFFITCLMDSLYMFFLFSADDGGDSAYDGKEELHRGLDIFVNGEEKSIHSETLSNVVDDIDSDDEAHS